MPGLGEATDANACSICKVSVQFNALGILAGCVLVWLLDSWTRLNMYLTCLSMLYSPCILLSLQYFKF